MCVLILPACVGGSVLYLVFLVHPHPEGAEGFMREQDFAVETAFVLGKLQLVVDERVIEADVFGVGLVVAVVEFVDMGPVDGAEAHWARLARRVNLAAGKVEGVEFGAGGADGADLGMSRGVTVGGDAVDAGGNDFAVARDNGAERSAAVLNVFL